MSNERPEEERLRLEATRNANAILRGRQRAEHELNAERERLRVTLASISDAVISTDAAGRVVYLNGVAEALTGCANEHATGRPMQEVFRLVSAAGGGPVESAAARVLATGAPVTQPPDTLLLARDGTARPIEFTASPMRDGSGEVIGVVVVFRDVTERRQTEVLHARLAAIVDSSQDAIVSKTLTGQILTWNAGAERLFEYPAAEAVGRPITIIIPPELLHEEREIIERISRGERIEHYETTRVARSGRRLQISLTISPIRDPDGRIVAVSKVARDVTERNRSAAALVASEQRYKAIVDASPECVKLVDADGTLLQMNPSGLQMVEADGAALGTCVYDLIAPEHRDRFRAFNERVCRGEGGTLAFDLIGRGGTRRNVETTAVPLPAPGGGYHHLAVTRDVTSRRRAEEALLDSEKQLRFVLDHAPVYLARCGADRRFRFVNRGYAERFGLQPDHFVGRTIEEVLGRPAYESFRKYVEIVLSGVRIAFEVTVPYPQMGDRFMHCVYEPEWDQTGTVDGWIAVISDFTDRKLAEDALRRSEAQFRQLSDSMPQIVWTARPDGFVDYYNQRWYEFTGFQKGEFGDTSWRPILHPDDLERCNETYYTAIRGGTTYQIEYRFRDRRTGGYRWFLGRARPVRNDSGEVVKWFGTCTDIDDTKRAEETIRFLADASSALAELKDTRSTLQQVAALAVPCFADWCAVDMLGDDGTLNRLAVTHTDREKVQLAHDLARRYPPNPDDPNGVMKVLRTGEPEWVAVITDEMLSQGARDEEHLRICRELGLKSYLCVPLRSRTRVIGALTFVTAESGRVYSADDQRAAEDLAHRAVIAIENANLMTALREGDRRKDEFIALLAHELRNPLAPLRNGLQVMRLAAGDPAALERARGMMDRQLRHMVRLVDDLLDVSRITRGKMDLRRAPVRLDEVIGTAVEAARPLIQTAGHELVLDLPDDPVVLVADHTRLAQVCANLLTNSAKYTPPAGTIWLTARADGRELTVAVRDTGIGIPAEAQASIFDMFSQVDRSIEKTTGGLGIGLALVKGLVEMHEGTVTVESPGAGAGSTFTVRLPVVRAGAEPPPAAPPPAPRTAPARVLIADDNSDGAESLAEMLQLLGHETHTAQDGVEAVEAAERWRPHVVLMDVGMPRLNGLDATRQIRQRAWGSGIKVIALTGWGQDADRQKSRDAGCDGHLVKPVGLADLQAVLAGVVGSGD